MRPCHTLNKRGQIARLKRLAEIVGAGPRACPCWRNHPVFKWWEQDAIDGVKRMKVLAEV